MFKIIRTATLNKITQDITTLKKQQGATSGRIQNLVNNADLTQDALNRKFNVIDEAVTQLNANHTQLRDAVLTKPDVLPVDKGVVDASADAKRLAAWESKERVLQERINYAQYDLKQTHNDHQFMIGMFSSADALEKSARDLTASQKYLSDLNKELLRHHMEKPRPIVVDKPRFIRNKKTGSIGLLKGNHITILSPHGYCDIGDVILEITPTQLDKFWQHLASVETVTVGLGKQHG